MFCGKVVNSFLVAFVVFVVVSSVDTLVGVRARDPHQVFQVQCLQVLWVWYIYTPFRKRSNKDFILSWFSWGVFMSIEKNKDTLQEAEENTYTHTHTNNDDDDEDV